MELVSGEKADSPARLVTRQDSPLPHLTGHAACFVGEEEVYVFGGTQRKNKYNWVWRFRLSTSTWEELEVRGTVKPPARCFHSMCYMRLRPSPLLPEADVLVVFGGLGDQNQRFNDTWIFDVSTRVWREVCVAGAVPGVRSHHVAVSYGAKLVVYGGCNPHPLEDLFLLQLDDGNPCVWIRPISQGQLPSDAGRGRLASRGVVWRHWLVVFGGYDGRQRFSDVHALDFRTMQWTRLLCQGVAPPKQYGGSVHLVNDHLVVMPGNHGFEINLPYLHALDLVSLDWKSIALPGEEVIECTPYHAGCSRGTLIFVHGGDEKPSSQLQGAVPSGTSSTWLVELKSIRFLAWSFGDAVDLVARNLDALSKESALAQSTIEHLRGMLGRVLAEEKRLDQAMRAREDRLQHSLSMLEAEKERLKCVDIAPGTRVSLDVGGVIYRTTVATLVKCEGSMLAAMFSGRFNLQRDSVDAPVFLDRDGRHFHIVLNHLRDYPSIAHLPEDTQTLRELLPEARFYLLEQLEAAILDKLAAATTTTTTASSQQPPGDVPGASIMRQQMGSPGM